ncbi:unnamed protein product [Prunus armeniaca]
MEKKLDSRTVSGIAKTGETMQIDILVLPSFDLNGNQNNQEWQTSTNSMVTEEETYENQVLLPENQDAVQAQEGTNNQTNARLRRSERPKKRALHDDYYVYLQDLEHDMNDIGDPMNFKQAMMSDKNENLWAILKSELGSTEKNEVWELVPLPQKSKPIGYK